METLKVIGFVVLWFIGMVFSAFIIYGFTHYVDTLLNAAFGP